MAMAIERERIGLIGSGQCRREGIGPQQVADGNGKNQREGLAREVGSHWLFSDMFVIDIQ